MKAIYERFGTNGSFNKEGVEQVTHMVAYEKMYYLLDDPFVQIGRAHV